VSERTLRRHFREELGLTSERYIQQARLAKAMQLLLEPGRRDTITEIALQVGYQNHSAFSAAFRRFAGQSPVAFRRAVR
jgi:AraC-like DNA-binding protein